LYDISQSVKMQRPNGLFEHPLLVPYILYVHHASLVPPQSISKITVGARQRRAHTRHAPITLYVSPFRPSSRFTPAASPRPVRPVATPLLRGAPAPHIRL